jgi:hypothetical protein
MAQCHCQEIEELHGGIRHPNLGCAGSGEIPLRIRVVYTIKMDLTQKKTRIVRRLTRRCTTALQIDDLETVITDIGTTYLYAEGSAIYTRWRHGIRNNGGPMKAREPKNWSAKFRT